MDAGTRQIVEMEMFVEYIHPNQEQFSLLDLSTVLFSKKTQKTIK